MSDDLITFTEAAKLLPKIFRQRAVHIATVRRWVIGGIKLKDGRNLKLQSIRIGASRFTTSDWIQDFIGELDGATEPVASPIAPAA